MDTLSNSSGHLDLIEDETSCGPMCQHPSCWASNQRREKGFPLKRERPPSPTEDDLGLPVLTVYNMLEDYGEDAHDRFPAKHSGRPTHNRLSSSLPALPRSSSQTSVKPCDSIPAIMSSSAGSLEAKKQSRMKVVEVQEVFDVEDLNNKWDETFITRQYYVWVPNPNRQSPRPKTLDPLKNMSVSKLTSQPQPIAPKDMTEQLVPEEVERQREEARVKKYTNIHSGISRGNTYSRGTTQRSARPYLDAESLQELLDLPREVLMSVLDHIEQSDLTSKDKVHSVIKQLQPQPDTHQSPTSTSMGTSELLRQKKVQLLGSKEKNYRNPDLLMTKPVFQLDGSGLEFERSSVVNSPVKELVSEGESSREQISMRELSKYKKPLPGIGASVVSRSDGSARIPSISLGLPELPSGIRQTRPFTYKKQQNVDFSLGPVPTPPVTGRSSDSGGSDHGTTLRVNMASASTRLQDRDLYGQYSREGTPMTEGSQPLRSMSPSTYGKLPKTPMVTPVTHPSPTRMSFQKDRTNASGQNGSRSPPPSRDISMSPVQKMIAPANSPNQSPAPSPEPGARGLVTIPEVMDDGSIRRVSSMGKMVSFVSEIPPAPPTSLDEQHTYTISVGLPNHPSGDLQTQFRKSDQSRGKRAETEGQEAECRPSQSPVSASSYEEWPNVDEAAFETAPYPQSVGLQSTSDQIRLSSAERSSKTPASKGRSSMASRESDKSSVARMIMDDSVKTESPGPPPPSPEPKDRKKSAEDKKRQELISRESLTMAPLYEESEAGETTDRSDKYDPGVMTTVSEFTPQPKSGKRKISVDTFINVDIQADKGSCENEDDTTAKNTFRSVETGMSGSGYTTERTATEGYPAEEVGEPDNEVKKQEADGDTTKDFNENRNVSGISRETTDQRKETEPDSVSANIDLEAVNYDCLPEEKKDDLPGSEDHQENYAEPSSSSQELKQEYSQISEEIHTNDLQLNEEDPTQPEEANDKPCGEESRGEDLEINREPSDEHHNEDDGSVEASAHLPEDESDESRGEEPQPVGDNMSQIQSTQEKTSSADKCGPETMDDEPPTFEAKNNKDIEHEKSVVDEQDQPEVKDSVIDVNIPPPVSRTNTAIEMVRSVIESAAAKVDEIIQSGSSPDTVEDGQTDQEK